MMRNKNIDSIEIKDKHRNGFPERPYNKRQVIKFKLE